MAKAGFGLEALWSMANAGEGWRPSGAWLTLASGWRPSGAWAHENVWGLRCVVHTSSSRLGWGQG